MSKQDEVRKQRDAAREASLLVTALTRAAQMLDDCVGFLVEGDAHAMGDCSARLHCWSCAEAHVDETLLAHAARTGGASSVSVYDDDSDDDSDGSGASVDKLRITPQYAVDCIGLGCEACCAPLVDDAPSARITQHEQ